MPLNLLAKRAGISRQAVWKACQRGNWRGHSPEVRVVRGKGGNAGKQYLVNSTSLPLELQLRLKPIEMPVQNRPKPTACRGRRDRADKGKKRVVISRQWDALVPFDSITKARIAEDLKQEIRGLLAQLGDTSRSWRATSWSRQPGHGSSAPIIWRVSSKFVRSRGRSFRKSCIIGRPTSFERTAKLTRTAAHAGGAPSKACARWNWSSETCTRLTST